jgi:hypothetical protein
MAKRTPEQEIAFQMQKMADTGVTISLTPASSRPDIPTDHPFAIIANAAKAAGIYEEKSK